MTPNSQAVPTGNGTQSRYVAAHYTTAAPRQLHPTCSSYILIFPLKLKLSYVTIVLSRAAVPFRRSTQNITPRPSHYIDKGSTCRCATHTRIHIIIRISLPLVVLGEI